MEQLEQRVVFSVASAVDYAWTVVPHTGQYEAALVADGCCETVRDARYASGPSGSQFREVFGLKVEIVVPDEIVGKTADAVLADGQRGLELLL